ncbi:MAP3K12-binding inhibitory protein 1 isoform X2 [Conger conger]|uniref:MAP3K12-binding inhibitory protein 1 isoform X2 n=1 Tax=Conger conger TaxID=82655 RepID=UPI002A5AA568|nr:MAP3K12-binding inhibitory protein 1 isoform X2 [Conger conger]
MMADLVELDMVGGVEMEHERTGGIILNEGTSTLRDFICDILKSMTRLSTELNLGEAALKIEANPTNVGVSALQAKDVLASLHDHISTLQSISVNLKLLMKPDASEVQKNDAGAIQLEEMGSVSAFSQQEEVNVQIRASKSEIDRRISAFIERKQLEINENNVREFCNVIDCNQENSCARTDAVFTPFPGFKSHVKDRPVPQNIYQRLKCMEDRILELEGLSPEYFQSTGNLHKRSKATPSQACSLTELDRKINALKASLLKKVNETQPTDTEDLPF